MADTYKGACFCGAVQFEATGTPAVAGYCHCKDCAAWSAGPINAFSLWAPDSVRVTKGESNIGTYHKTENSYRKFCKTCGGHLGHLFEDPSSPNGQHFCINSTALDFKKESR